MSRGTAEEPRKVTGWAVEDILLTCDVLTAVVRNNPHAGFPISGDAKRRPAWLVLNHGERIRLLNEGTKAGTK